MKKVVFVIIFTLILATSLVKNSTKEIEDNYLSSPDKLTQYQNQYFEKNLIKIDVTKIKKLTEKNSQIQISDFIEKTKDD